MRSTISPKTNQTRFLKQAYNYEDDKVLNKGGLYVNVSFPLTRNSSYVLFSVDEKFFFFAIIFVLTSHISILLSAFIIYFKIQGYL